MAEDEKKLEQLRGHCPQCGPNIWADVVGHHRVADSDDRSGVWWETNHRMLCCCGCKTVYFRESHVFSEDYDYGEDLATGEPNREYNERITYWPAPSKRNEPDWLKPAQIDGGLYSLLQETYKSLDVDARLEERPNNLRPRR